VCAAQSLTLAQAEKLALQILKQVMEEKLQSKSVELAVVPIDTGLFQFRNEAQIEVCARAVFVFLRPFFRS